MMPEAEPDDRQAARNAWIDFGPTFAAEKLASCHGLRLGVETLRQMDNRGRPVDRPPSPPSLSAPASAAA